MYADGKGAVSVEVSEVPSSILKIVGESEAFVYKKTEPLLIYSQVDLVKVTIAV